MRDLGYGAAMISIGALVGLLAAQAISAFTLSAGNAWPTVAGAALAAVFSVSVHYRYRGWTIFKKAN